jgi:hypothetical protein
MTGNNNPLSKKRIESSAKPSAQQPQEETQTRLKKKRDIPARKVMYIEIDDEVTSIYDRMKSLKYKNIYLVVPKRAVIFQSIVNLKILKRKAEDLGKDIFIISNDQNGTHLARKIGLPIYDKLEGHEHPSLVSGRFMDDNQDITPLKASVNTLDDDIPTRRNEKKFSITDLVRRGGKGGFSIIPKFKAKAPAPPSNKQKRKNDLGKLVLVAPNRQALVGLVVVSMIILLTITYIALPGATIALTPKSNVLSTSANIVLADIEANRAELDTHPQQEIASYIITKKIQKVLSYQSTGKEFRGENARGTVTVMNLSGNAWPLVVKTRFQTGEGMIFRSQGPVTVPASRDGKTPGTVDIPVIADELDALNNVIGERGNLGPSKFFLPGLSADNQKKLYAESKTAFTGGKTAVIKKISKEDLDAANRKMADDLKASAQAELQSMLKERNGTQKTNLVLLTGTEAVQTSEPKVTVPANLEGQKLETFDVQGEIVATGIAYNLDELLTILKTELKLKKNPEKRLTYIDDSSLTTRVVENDKVGKKIKITATIKGIEEYEISPDKENGDRLIKMIKEHVVGKKVDEAESYIQNLPEIDKVHVESWPAWAPTLPGIPDNIKIEIKRSEI